MNDAQLINQNSSDVEYYTPPEIIEAAHIALCGIGLDPASSEVANQRVGALRWYGAEADGMQQRWTASSVWMNHPFGRPEPACPPTGCPRKAKNPSHVCHTYPLHGNAEWIRKIEREFTTGAFGAGCNITFAATSEAWFRPLLRRPQCYLVPRTNYLLPDGTVKKGVTKGSVVTYFGEDVQRFRDAFKGLGEVKI